MDPEADVDSFRVSLVPSGAGAEPVLGSLHLVGPFVAFQSSETSRMLSLSTVTAISRTATSRGDTGLTLLTDEGEPLVLECGSLRDGLVDRLRREWQAAVMAAASGIPLPPPPVVPDAVEGIPELPAAGAAAEEPEPLPQPAGAGGLAVVDPAGRQRKSIETWENQRWYPLKGWTDKLLPTDRPAWSDIKGSHFQPKSCFDPVIEVVGPTGQVTKRWRLVWRLYPGDGPGADKADSAGWVYAVDFPQPFGKKNAASYVRRRRWEGQYFDADDGDTPGGRGAGGAGSDEVDWELRRPRRCVNSTTGGVGLAKRTAVCDAMYREIDNAEDACRYHPGTWHGDTGGMSVAGLVGGAVGFAVGGPVGAVAGGSLASASGRKATLKWTCCDGKRFSAPGCAGRPHRDVVLG